MFLNKDTPCGPENEVIQKRSCDMLDVVNKKETAFSFVLYKIFDILYGRQMLQQYQMIGEIFFRFCAKLRWKNEYCCVVQMHGLEHTRRFRWFWSDAVVFQLFKVFSSSWQHIRCTYRANIRDQLIKKYNYCECWCYIIRIKRCFLRTNQRLLLHVLAVCL